MRRKNKNTADGMVKRWDAPLKWHHCLSNRYLSELCKKFPSSDRFYDLAFLPHGKISQFLHICLFHVLQAEEEEMVSSSCQGVESPTLVQTKSIAIQTNLHDKKPSKDWINKVSYGHIIPMVFPLFHCYSC